jgi:hypothetical protein
MRQGRFESRVLPLFKRKSQAAEKVLPEFYLHGLAQGDFELPLNGLLGEKTPLSGPTVASEGEVAHQASSVANPTTGGVTPGHRGSMASWAEVSP